MDFKVFLSSNYLVYLNVLKEILQNELFVVRCAYKRNGVGERDKEVMTELQLM